MMHGELDLGSFLRAVDQELARIAPRGATLSLRVMGRSAMIATLGTRLATKDVDVVEEPTGDLWTEVVRRFGKGSKNALYLGHYLETVSSGLPPLPCGYIARAIPVPGDFRVLRVSRLEPHDLAISKLYRFHAGDREDLEALADAGLLVSTTLAERFKDAFWTHEDQDPKLVRAERNLHRLIAYLEGRMRPL